MDQQVWSWTSLARPGQDTCAHQGRLACPNNQHSFAICDGGVPEVLGMHLATLELVRILYRKKVGCSRQGQHRVGQGYAEDKGGGEVASGCCGLPPEKVQLQLTAQLRAQTVMLMLTSLVYVKLSMRFAQGQCTSCSAHPAPSTCHCYGGDLSPSLTIRRGHSASFHGLPCTPALWEQRTIRLR